MTHPEPKPSQPTRPIVIEARGLHKSFGALKVLDDIDLVVRRGEVVVIIGSSGSGKSTLLRALNFLDPPDQGQVSINGYPFGFTMRNGKAVPVSDTTLSAQRRQIGMVFQQFNLFAHMNVLDNVRSGPVHSLGQRADEAAVNARRLVCPLPWMLSHDKTVKERRRRVWRNQVIYNLERTLRILLRFGGKSLRLAERNLSESELRSTDLTEGARDSEKF